VPQCIFIVSKGPKNHGPNTMEIYISFYPVPFLDLKRGLQENEVRATPSAIVFTKAI